MSRRGATVLRADYDALQSRYDKLLDAFLALRVAGANPAREDVPERVSTVTDDVDLVRDTQRRMAVEAARADFMAQGLTEAEATAEAERTIGSLFAPIMGDFQ